MAKKKQGASCRVLWCLDPKTGASRLALDGKCPPGTLKVLSDALTEKGVKLPTVDEATESLKKK